MDFRNTFVACSTDLGRVWHGANDSGRDPGGTHNSDSGLYDAYNSGHILRGANDTNRATRGPDIHDSGCISHRVYDFGRATRGPDILDLPTALFASPLDCVGATGTTMEEEFSVLIANNTWDLVACPVCSNIITDK
jgi:hypothetical protein